MEEERENRGKEEKAPIRIVSLDKERGTRLSRPLHWRVKEKKEKEKERDDDMKEKEINKVKGKGKMNRLPKMRRKE